MCFREWIISWIRMMPSKICLSSTNPVCYGDISPDIRGFNLLAMTFVMIFKITLHKDIGRNLYGVSTRCSLGIKVRKVELKALRTCPILLDSSTTIQISSLTKSQQLWKKSMVNPSSLGTLPFSILKTTSSTSYLSIGLISIALCSGVTSLGIFRSMSSVSHSYSSSFSLSRSA